MMMVMSIFGRIAMEKITLKIEFGITYFSQRAPNLIKTRDDHGSNRGSVNELKNYCLMLID